MQPLHDRYCDETHTPRQACNDALAAPELRASTPVEPIVSEPEPIIAPEPENPLMPSAVREAIAIAQMAPPTPYVTREWERTAAAVAGVSEADGVASADDGSRRAGVMRAVAVVGVIVALLVVVLRVRGGAADEG